MKFKEGDIVKCPDAGPSGRLNETDIYIVEYVDYDCVYVVGNGFGYPHKRFDLIGNTIDQLEIF